MPASGLLDCEVGRHTSSPFVAVACDSDSPRIRQPRRETRAPGDEAAIFIGHSQAGEKVAERLSDGSRIAQAEEKPHACTHQHAGKDTAEPEGLTGEDHCYDQDQGTEEPADDNASQPSEYPYKQACAGVPRGHRFGATCPPNLQAHLSGRA